MGYFSMENILRRYLIFGVQDRHGVLEIVGVQKSDKVQNDFLSALRTGDKLNHIIHVKEERFDLDGKTILVFYIPESRRSEKPVYLKGDIRLSYIRRGAGDEKCTPSEIERFLRDAAAERFDSITMERDDTPPDFVAFRETFINILCHQDYQDHTRKPEIRHFTDCTIFWNPGDAFATGNLLEPGPKEVRNPGIVMAFRRIGLSENAGWGLNDVIANWKKLGYDQPVIENCKANKYFRVTLTTEISNHHRDAHQSNPTLSTERKREKISD